MQLYARHGDLVIEKVEHISGELTKAKSVTFAGDSSGHPHTLTALAPVLMRREGRRTFVRLEQRAEIAHGKPDGHRTISLEPGSYVVRPLRERGDSDDRAVED